MLSSSVINKIPKLWNGGQVFVLGGGPSLLDEDLSLIYDKHVIGVNDAFKLGDWVDVSWSTDCEWLKWNEVPLANFPGVVLTGTQCKCVHPRAVRVKRKNQNGLYPGPEQVYWNKNSGASAINLAYHLGATEVILLGFDMKLREGKHNWHDNHKRVPRSTIYQNLFLKPFDNIAVDAQRLGLSVINATSDTDLLVFPRKSLLEVIHGQS